MTIGLARTLAVMENAGNAVHTQNADTRIASNRQRRRRMGQLFTSPLARPMALFPFFRP
jgi:hypothetical protein